MAARTLFGSNVLKNLREIRLHLCQKSAESAGARAFVEQYYVPLKTENPVLPVLVRECSGVSPRLWVRYAFGREQSVALGNLTAAEVAKELERLSRG